MRLYIMHKFFLLILFTLLSCINCSTKDSFREEVDYLYFKTKREPLPVDIQKLFIENLYNKLTLEITNSVSKREPSDQFFSYESIYECVTTFEDWGIGVSRKQCSECMKNTILIYYISPEITWKSLAGRAGYVSPKCRYIVVPGCRLLGISCQSCNGQSGLYSTL